jgi:hypothetical protein
MYSTYFLHTKFQRHLEKLIDIMCIVYVHLSQLTFAILKNCVHLNQNQNTIHTINSVSFIQKSGNEYTNEIFQLRYFKEHILYKTEQNIQ